MAVNRKRVLAEALLLGAEDRAVIAGELIRSLDDGPDEELESVEAAWAQELRERLQKLDAGEAETLSREDALRFITSDAGDQTP